MEHCSWALALPRTELQTVLTSTFVQKADRLRVMVVHRSDATQQRRMASNHDELMTKLRLALPNCITEVFIGNEYNLAQVRWKKGRKKGRKEGRLIVS